MKTFFALFLCFMSASCALKTDVIRDMVCEIWRGWGENFANEACSLSVNASCVAAFDIVPRFFTFVFTLNFSHLGTLISDLWIVLTQNIRQLFICRYGSSFVGTMSTLLWPYAGYAMYNAVKHWETLEMNIACTVMFWISEEYYKAGECLSEVTKDLFYFKFD